MNKTSFIATYRAVNWQDIILLIQESFYFKF